MKKYISFYLIFLSLALLQEHFIVGINQTGESTLFIFEDDITPENAEDILDTLREIIDGHST